MVTLRSASPEPDEITKKELEASNEVEQLSPTPVSQTESEGTEQMRV